jgi:spore maturation protein CgeB
VQTLHKIALVAKPWRGGLGSYVGMALEDRFPGRVQYLDSYPAHTAEKLVYRLGRSAWRRRLAERIDRLDADVVLFLNLLPEFASLPAKKGYVAWLTDSPAPVLNQLKPFARVFVSDPGYAEEVRATVGDERYAGVLPFACQPSVHRRIAQSAGATGLCFIANRDAKRDRLLRYLFDHKRFVEIYGNYFLRHPLYWRRPWAFHPPVENAAMGQVYAKFAASLNIHAEVVRGGTNMRTFECAAYGIPQLVEYRPGLERLFDIEQEISVFHDERDILSSLDEVEADIVNACRRAERARERVLQEHTYQHRVACILEKL